MVCYVDPVAIEEETLRLKRLSDDDYVVNIGSLLAGRILRQAWAGAPEVWTWHLTGPFVPATLHPAHGAARTLDEAKRGFLAKFETWWGWAAELGKDVAWHA